jgi:hypothetical protein
MGFTSGMSQNQRKSGFKETELGAKICVFKSTFIFPTVLESFRSGRSQGTFVFFAMLF